VRAEHPRVAIRTLGCKVNRSESEALAEALLGWDIALVDDESAADLVVVNTCTVTGEADAKARKEVRRALAAMAGPIVVTGCLASLDPAGLRALDPRVLVESDRAALSSRVGELLGEDLRCPPVGTRAAAPRGAFRTRVMVKVQDGCDRRCAYCIVPDARGGPRSVPADDVLARVSGLARAGAPEVVLTGINIGGYADPTAGFRDLSDLMRAVAACGARRVRVSSIEPLDLTDRFIEAVSTVPEVVPHLHIPLQSGCERTLSAMGRGYSASYFADMLARARRALPSLAVTSDVIVGFPGETDADFSESLAFVEACGFVRLHVFRYSQRAGTPAAAIPVQVAPAVKAARAAQMRALSDRAAQAHARARTGQLAWVLVERVEGDVARGTTEDGMRVRIAGTGVRPRDVVEVTLVTGPDGSLWGDTTSHAARRLRGAGPARG
jgi:threonylcarbamoyladenosine tRNA methylthiotransferase MtaB